MHQVHFIQQLYNKFFPKSFARGLKLTEIPKEWEDLSSEEKKKLANELLSKGELLLLKEDLTAIKSFNLASQLDPSNPLVWYRQGLAFFEYGTHETREKALLLASKNFKIATSLDSNVFDYWWAWANVLLTLGNETKENHYFLDAKKKYKQAITLSQNQSRDILGELYWDYALVYTKIADQSGEAIDLRLAIQAFHSSFAYQNNIPAPFWYDFGNAYLQMGLLINDNNLYLQAIENFKKAIEKTKQHYDSWTSLAFAYSQLYLNTMDEEYFSLADEHYSRSLEINPVDAELWLEWAQLLGESGKLNKDPKKLRASIEKCIRAHKRKKKLPQIIGQWVESLSLLGAYTNRLELIVEAENKIMKTTELYSEESDLWHSYGICMHAFSLYYNDFEYDEIAIEKFQIGLSLDRSNADLWQAIAYSHSRIGKDGEDSDMLERACKFYKKAIDLKPACPSLTFEYAVTLAELGKLSANQPILEEAIHQFETTLNVQKNSILQHPEWIFHYGIALDLLGDCLEQESCYLKAIEIFNNVLLVDPDYPKIHYRLALCYSHLMEISPETQLLNRGVDCFKLAIKQDEEADEIWLEWGLMLILFAHDNLSLDAAEQYYLEAEQKLIRAGQLGNPDSYYHLACLYSLTNRFDESIHFLEKAHDMATLPPIEELIEDEWLDGIRSTDLFSHFLNHIENKENIVE